MMPSPAVDFNFDSTCTSPYVSAPSSPQRFGNYFFSAPTSPTRASAFFNEFSLFTTGGSSSSIPFNWEEKPGVPKAEETETIINDDDDTDFAFDFSGQLERPSLSADELFDGGKIKPLKPPPRFQYSESTLRDSPKSPRSPKRMLKQALSPRQKKNEFQPDPFSVAIEQTRKEKIQQLTGYERGRESERICNLSNNGPREKGKTRSLSPFRESDMQSSKQLVSSSSSPSPSSSTWYSKWKLKDLLLFRSASEGRATSGKDPLKKYSLLKRSHTEDVKNSSFRSTDSCGSVSSSRRRGPVSAHEMHYTVNRAVSEEMRKKTFLPYKSGLLGCLGFNPAVHEISRGLGSSILSRD